MSISEVFTPVQLETLSDQLADKVADRLAKRPQFVDRHGLAEALGVSVATIDRLRVDDQIPYRQAGNRLLFSVSEVAAALPSGGATS